MRSRIARQKRPVLLVGLLCLAGLLISACIFIGQSEDARLRRATDHLAKREFQAALKLLNDYLNSVPRDLSARLMAAEAARRGRDYEQAKEHLRKFRLDDGPPLALELEERLLAAQQGDEAQVELLFSFCQDHPDAAEAPAALEAVIVADLDRLARPLETPQFYPVDDQPLPLKRLLQCADRWLARMPSLPDQVQGLVWRGRAREMGGDHPGAIEDLQRALELDPKSLDARAYFALSISQARPREAIAHFKQLVEQAPGDVRLKFALAGSYRGEGDDAQAKDLLDEILQTQPRNSQVLLERAQVALDERDLESAKGFLERAAAVGPETARLHLVFARYMTIIGDSARAKEHRDRFQELNAKRGDK